MFKTTTCMAAMTLSTVTAVKIQQSFRPPDAAQPWHKGPKYPEWTDPTDHPVNYFVPNFGTDSDINSTFKNTAAAEEQLGHVMQASFDPPKPPPRDYFVPAFGEDDDIKASKKNTADAEKLLKHEMSTAAPPDPPPRNYFVPAFGEDAEISQTKKSVALAEGQLGHSLSTDPPPKDPPRNYFVPNFGEDEDIEFSKRNIASAEAARGKWNVKRDGNGAWILPSVESNQFGNYKAENNWPSPLMNALVQTGSASDPICSSAGCTQYKHKKKALGYDINYAVPNFGRDKDINDDFESIKLAEDMIGHKFQIGTAASKAKWKNPAKDVDYNFAPKMDGDVISTQKNLADAESNLGHKWVIDDLQIHSDVHLDSDPICSSAGCDQYKHKKKPRGYDINYPVPNFGVDKDIVDNFGSLKLSENALSHKLIMGTDASKAKWHNPAKDTDYNFAPKLDADMITTKKNLGDAENSLGHKWVIDDLQIASDVNSDPICSSAGCDQYKHKKKPRGYDINYPVPNFGVDKDIIDNFGSLKLSEDALSHKLIMGTDASKAKWHNPAKDTDYNFAPKLDGDMITTKKNLGDAENSLGHKWVIDDLQLESDLKLQSDPICSSAGCTQYKHKKKALGYDINYAVPNFGRDKDINDDFESIKLAEDMIGHKFQIGTAASKAKWKNPAKDVDYNFAPKMDGDVISTQKNLADAESNLGHKWVIED